MKRMIIIEDNTYGFLHKPGSVTVSDDSWSIEGLTLENQPLIVRFLVKLLFVILALAIFFVIERFIVFPLFGDIIKQYGKYLGSESDISMIHLIALGKIVFGSILFFLVPFIGGFWIANKVFDPLRARLSSSKTVNIPYEKIHNTTFSSDNGMILEVEDSYKQGKTSTISIDDLDTELYLQLFHAILSDYNDFTTFAGVERVEEENESYFLLKFFESYYQIHKDRIQVPETQEHYSESIPIMYLYRCLFAYKKKEKHIKSDHYYDIQSIDNNALKEEYEMINEQFKTDPSLVTEAFRNIGGEISTESGETTCILSPLPLVELLVITGKRVIQTG